MRIPGRERFDLLRRALPPGVSFRRARKRGLVGERFFSFGRGLGWRLWWRGMHGAKALLACPVSSTRFFEFDFADRHAAGLPEDAACLDVSSPFLFAFHAVRTRPGIRVRMANPDGRDLAKTRRMADDLALPRLETVEADVAALVREGRRYDAIWSLSVLEHIGEEHGGDRAACRDLWHLLKPGGRLILTLPTDKRSWEEFRDRDPYGLRGAPEDGRGHFFQRFYDETALRERIFAAVGREPAALEWFGVKESGHFHRYIEAWREQGAREVVWNDPLDIAEHYQAYASFAAMPGEGVCGLCFHKPMETAP